MWLPCSLMAAQTLGIPPTVPFRAYPWQAYMTPGAGLWLLPGVHCIPVPSTALSKGASFYSAILQPFNQYSVVYIFWGSAESHSISLPSLHGREGWALDLVILV